MSNINRYLPPGWTQTHPVNRPVPGFRRTCCNTYAKQGSLRHFGVPSNTKGTNAAVATGKCWSGRWTILLKLVQMVCRIQKNKVVENPANQIEAPILLPLSCKLHMATNMTATLPPPGTGLSRKQRHHSQVASCCGFGPQIPETTLGARDVEVLNTCLGQPDLRHPLRWSPWNTPRRAEGCLPVCPHFFASASIPKVHLRRKRPNSSCIEPNAYTPFRGMVLYPEMVKSSKWGVLCSLLIGFITLLLPDWWASISPNMPPRNGPNSILQTQSLAPTRPYHSCT